MKTSWDLVVLGSGPGGQKAAIQGAKLGKRVLVVEREVAVGGECVHRGTIPSKTLRETAVALTSLRRRCGESFEITRKGELFLASLMDRVGDVVTAHEHFITQQLERNDVVRWHGRASFVGKHELEVEGVDRSVRSVRADVVVLATGSRPRAPLEVAIDHEHVFDSDSMLSMTYLPKSLVVLGSGVIACEYASIFQALGTEVTIVDSGAAPLGFLDREISDRFRAAFEALGGRFLPHARVVSAEWNGATAVVTRLEGGIELTSEKLLCARGRVANVAGLHLDRVGLCTNDRGVIPVDAFLRTSVPHVYAVGDVAGPPGLASTAMDQGRRAVAHAFGLDPGVSAELVPSGIYTIPEISCVGLTEAQAIERYGSAVVGRASFDEVARGQIMGIDDGLLKLIADPAGSRVLGVQIVGEGAAELVHLGQMAMLGGMTVDAFVRNVFNFPTLAEAYRIAALDIVKRRAALVTGRGSVMPASLRGARLSAAAE